MGFLKESSRGTQNRPWMPFGKKTSGVVQQADSSDDVKEKKKQGFCDPNSSKACITVCVPKPGCTCGCEAVRNAFNEEIAKRGLSLSIGDAKTGCAGSCKRGAFIGFPAKGFFYKNVTPDMVPEIVEETIVNGHILFPLLSINPDRSFRTDLLYEKETGLLAAIDDSVCMVEIAKYFLDFEEGLSCGKCVPCRIGMKRMQENVERIISGQGTPEDLEQIRALCQTMKETPHCDFAVTSSRPILSAITYFEDEFKAHIERQECPSGVCKELVELQRKRAARERLRKRK